MQQWKKGELKRGFSLVRSLILFCWHLGEIWEQMRDFNSYLLYIKNQPFLAPWENEKPSVDSKIKGICQSNDSKGHCKTGFGSRLVTFI